MQQELHLLEKYRPKNLLQFHGQAQIVQRMKNYVLAPARRPLVILEGSLGCGKSSAAIALAKSLNCELGVSLQPCGECKTCKAIEAKTSFGVQSLDCAFLSKEKVLNVINEAAIRGATRYKIYIFDEFHNLSKEAQESFLKTTETPPPNTHFIIVTTEIEKILPTLQSRADMFNFSPLSDSEMVVFLQSVLQREGVDFGAYTDEILEVITRNNDGIPRNALKWLETFLNAAKTEPITPSIAASHFKAPDPETIGNLFLLAACGNPHSFGMVVTSLDKMQYDDPLKVITELSSTTLDKIKKPDPLLPLSPQQLLKGYAHLNHSYGNPLLSKGGKAAHATLRAILAELVLIFSQ